MAERVVDRLEVICVDDEQCPGLNTGAADLHSLEKRLAIEKTSHVIDSRACLQFDMRFLELEICISQLAVLMKNIGKGWNAVAMGMPALRVSATTPGLTPAE